MLGSIVLILMVLVLAAVSVALWLKVRALRHKFRAVVDAEEEADQIRSEVDSELKSVRSKLRSEIETARINIERDEQQHLAAMQQAQTSLDTVRTQYDTARSIYDRLQREVQVLEENLADISFGLYRPHYDFETPEQYKNQLDKIYESKKATIRDGQAISCPQNWTVNGSTREGKKMIKEESKLMLRSFNNEVEAAVSRVSWNNATKMEERIRKAFDTINELGNTMQIKINRTYLDLALAELRLTFELEQKQQEAKEEQRRIREQMREEELAQREFERAKKAAESDEVRYQKALAAARAEIERANASEMDSINTKIASLESKLAEAQQKLQHAVSMAQLTKSGHVYIISNVGSFGDDVFKIGMTRRLDPTERVDELGSASVPFPYDIHGMIYTDDAPGLENAFHREFTHRRVNLVNSRKEFFRVNLAELEKFAQKHHADIQFTKLAEAREYRETLATLEKSLETNIRTPERQAEQFPNSLAVGTI